MSGIVILALLCGGIIIIMATVCLQRSGSKRYDIVATSTLGKNPQIKISLTNADDTIDLKKLAWMQHQRYWIERAFEDGKSECGMADYQVRKWSAWHHTIWLL